MLQKIVDRIVEWGLRLLLLVLATALPASIYTAFGFLFSWPWWWVGIGWVGGTIIAIIWWFYFSLWDNNPF